MISAALVLLEAVLATSGPVYRGIDRNLRVDIPRIEVGYSPSAIHFGLRAHARPGTVRATLADRDRIDNDDWVQIYLGTFNDGRQASVIGVNPLGVQLDGAVVESANRGGGGFGGLAGGRVAPDLSPDFLFDSKGKVTAFGYQIEVRIPFRSLRYQSAKTQDWGLHVAVASRVPATRTPGPPRDARQRRFSIRREHWSG